MNKDLRVALLGAAIMVLLIPAAQWFWFLRPLQLVFGLAYVLFVPGYCLTAALLPRAADVDGIERIALSVGLSVAWMSVLALVLDALPAGLRLWPIAIGELVSIVTFCAAARWRRSRLPAGIFYVPDLAWQPRGWWRTLAPGARRAAVLITAAVSLTLAAVAWTYSVPASADFATEFYMLGEEGLAESFPRTAIVGRDINVTLGIANHERSARNYRVEIWAANPATGGRSSLVGEYGPYELPMGGQRSWQASWTMPSPGKDQVAEFLLFAEGTVDPYRSLRLWLDVVEPTK